LKKWIKYVGITALADVLILMGIPYGSNRGRQKAGQIMKFLNDRSHYYSYLLGKERGNFPVFDESIYNLNSQYREKALAFYKEFLPEDEYEDLITSSSSGYMRNAATTTIAPTGTLTSLLGCEGYGYKNAPYKQ